MKILRLIVLMILAVIVSVYSQTPTVKIIANAGVNSFPSTLIESNGYLIGTTAFGGYTGNVFQLSLNGGALTILHQFVTSTDGSEPLGVLVIGTDGNFYGALAFGATIRASAIFRMTPEGDVSTVYQFTPRGVNGDCVGQGLTLGQDGRLYGVGYCGGDSDVGVVFSLTLQGQLNVIHQFHGTDGEQPGYPPIQTSDGTLVGVTPARWSDSSGGTILGGTIFGISSTGAFSTLYEFPSTSYPKSVIVANGELYGWYSNGGYNGGLFTMTPNGAVTTLKQFTDGSTPCSPPIQADDGFFYGLTDNVFNTQIPRGTLYRFDAAGNFTTIQTFDSGPEGSLFQASDRNIYGTMQNGDIFKITLIPPRFANISTRDIVLTGDNVMIGGFIITGTQSKKVMIRAIGPSLSQQGVAGAMGDPTLELHRSDGALIATNDNWQATQIGGVITSSQVAEIQNSGLTPGDPAESAIIATLVPGAYTAIVRGANNTTGVGLVESYDLDQTVDSKLANISTRGLVQTVNNVLIGGFIVRGTDSEKVLVRAIGPSLTAAGVTNALQDPTLELHGSDGTLLASNDDWRSDQEAEITATNLAPSNDAEAAISATLPPGAYTAIVRGKNQTTGLALVEVYQVN